jgi:hypothetical protein
MWLAILLLTIVSGVATGSFTGNHKAGLAVFAGLAAICLSILESGKEH